MRATTKKALTSKVALATPAPAAESPGTTKTNRAGTKVARAKASAAKNAAVQAVSAPPRWAFPTRPNGFAAPTVDVVRRRSKPTEDMRAEAVDFVSELRTGTTYRDDFGKRAPDPTALADVIEIATQWDAVYSAVAPVAEYALAMRGAAWDVALKPVNKLKSAYESAVADEPTLAGTWRKTAKFFGAREEPAQRAVETKAKAKKAAKKAGKVGPPKT